MENHQVVKNRILSKDRKLKKLYQESEPEFKLTKTLIKKRLQKGLTQKELAQKIGTKQSAISRLESGDQNPTLEFLQKVAKALNIKIQISIQ